jgi:hypothetical protein
MRPEAVTVGNYMQTVKSKYVFVIEKPEIRCCEKKRLLLSVSLMRLLKLKQFEGNDLIISKNTDGV